MRILLLTGILILLPFLNPVALCQQLGQQLGQELSQELGQELSQESGQESGPAASQDGVEDLGQDLANSPSSSFQSGPDLFPGFLQAEVLNIGGKLSLLIEALGPDGETDREWNDTLSVVIDNEEQELAFSMGFAVWPLDDSRMGSVRLEYWTPDGPQTLQKGFHTLGTQTRSGSVIPWTSILPPLIAILMALLLREVIGSLLAAVIFGSWLLLGLKIQNLPAALTASFDHFILRSIADTSHASIILFSLLIGGMVAVISRNGGMYGIVEKLSVLANSTRNTQLVTWLLGVAIFFDDYANTLVVGNTMRPVTDRFKISREKLAYLVDSTAAPVAAVAFITTWIGAELDYIDGAIAHLNLNESAYGVFLSSLSYAFYPFLTLAFMLMLIVMQRDFSSMYRAEHRARTTGHVLDRSGMGKKRQAHDGADLEPEDGIRHHWWNALIPVLTVITVTLAGLWQTGFQSLAADGQEYVTYWANENLSGRLELFFRSDLLSMVIGSADSYTALIWASASGLLVAALLSLISRTLPMRELVDASLDGFKTMLPAIAILVLAWSLASVTEQLHTAGFLAGSLNDKLSPLWMPAITFVLAAIISFSTGSSWSTMAILYPLILPLTYKLGLSSGMEYESIMPIFHNVTAMVLAGSVLGDHCSPISDTTILSSLASNCPHVDHVRTQLPYALTVGGVSLLLGGCLAVLGVPIWINYILGLLTLFAIVRLAGKPLGEWNIRIGRKANEIPSGSGK